MTKTKFIPGKIYALKSGSYIYVADAWGILRHPTDPNGICPYSYSEVFLELDPRFKIYNKYMSTLGLIQVIDIEYDRRGYFIYYVMVLASRVRMEARDSDFICQWCN
jgi:hypothetical protein